MIFKDREDDEVMMIIKDFEMKLFDEISDKIKFFCRIIMIFLNKELRFEDSMITMNLLNTTIFSKELIDNIDFIAFS